MEWWSSGVVKTVVTDTLQRSSIEDGIGRGVLTFKALSPIVSHYSIPPGLRYSGTPVEKKP
jgi:hypothetical protein